MQGHPSQLLADPLPLIIKTFEKLTFIRMDLLLWQSQSYMNNDGK